MGIHTWLDFDCGKSYCTCTLLMNLPITDNTFISLFLSLSRSSLSASWLFYCINPYFICVILTFCLLWCPLNLFCQHTVFVCLLRALVFLIFVRMKYKYKISSKHLKRNRSWTLSEAFSASWFWCYGCPHWHYPGYFTITSNHSE